MSRHFVLPASPSIQAADVRLHTLDLFSGLEGWSRPFRDRGHSVVTLDAEPRFGADFTRDILSLRSLGELERSGRFDVVLASPPCQTFSLLSGWRYWRNENGVYVPTDERAEQGLAIMRHTFDLIERYAPRFHVIENPRGYMRHHSPRPPESTVWYCRLGETRAKPTDLWHNLPVRLPEPCAYGNPACDHEKVRQGSHHGGTLGLKTAARRSLIPYGLGLTVALAVEYELGANRMQQKYSREIEQLRKAA